MAFATVDGTITRTFFNGKGAEVTETFEKNDGTEGKKTYSLWFEAPHGLTEGTTGKWSGSLSWKIEPWTGRDGIERQSVKISLNKAKPAKGGAEAISNQSQAPADGGNQSGAQMGSSDPWNAPANYTEETPW